jgi:DNA-binding MarR family transcriptional regulator
MKWLTPQYLLASQAGRPGALATVARIRSIMARSLGFNLRLAQTASFQAFAREVGGEDIRPGRFAILSLIGRNPGISQTALSIANGRDKSTLTPALNDLARRGLINRTRVKGDRRCRCYQLTLTSMGTAVLQRLTECAIRHERILDRVIGQRDRAKFLEVLRRLRTELG